MSAIVYWITSLAALAGVILNIRRSVASFWIWGATNSVSVYADLTHGLLPQAALQGAYLVMSVVGIVKWSQLAKRGVIHAAKAPA